MPKFHVSKEDSRDLGFAYDCLLSEAITEAEFEKWVHWVIEKSDEELPTYFFELPDLEERVSAFCDVLEFVPVDGLSDSESDALDGIAYQRGHKECPPDYDPHISRQEALEALMKHPHVKQRFKETFPFIDF